jgi:hypothetical protein
MGNCNFQPELESEHLTGTKQIHLKLTPILELNVAINKNNF